MSPTLLDGERYILFRCPYLWRTPRKGEIVVIKDPQDQDLSIKRIVALAANGYGYTQIARTLTTEKVPPFGEAIIREKRTRSHFSGSTHPFQHQDWAISPPNKETVSSIELEVVEEHCAHACARMGVSV